MNPRAAATAHAVIAGVVVLFQLALAAGAPWSAYATSAGRKATRLLTT